MVEAQIPFDEGPDATKESLERCVDVHVFEMQTGDTAQHRQEKLCPHTV